MRLVVRGEALPAELSGILGRYSFCEINPNPFRYPAFGAVGALAFPGRRRLASQ